MERSTSDNIIMDITCEGCKTNCTLKLYKPFTWRWQVRDSARFSALQGEAIKAKMEQFKACPRMPQDNSLTILTKKAPETQKTYRDIPSIL